MILDKNPNKNQDEALDEAPTSLSAPDLALSSPVSLSVSCSGPASSLLAFFFRFLLWSYLFSIYLSFRFLLWPYLFSTYPSFRFLLWPCFFLASLIFCFPLWPCLAFAFLFFRFLLWLSFFSFSLYILFPVSPTFIRRAFSLVVFCNSLVCQYSVPQAKRYLSVSRKKDFFLPRKN